MVCILCWLHIPLTGQWNKFQHILMFWLVHVLRICLNDSAWCSNDVFVNCILCFISNGREETHNTCLWTVSKQAVNSPWTCLPAMFKGVNWPLKRIDKVSSCWYQPSLWVRNGHTVLTWNNSSCPALHLIFSNTPHKKSNTLSFLSMTVKFLYLKEIGSNSEGKPHLLCLWPLHGHAPVLEKQGGRLLAQGLNFLRWQVRLWTWD